MGIAIASLKEEINKVGHFNKYKGSGIGIRGKNDGLIMLLYFNLYNIIL